MIWQNSTNHYTLLDFNIKYYMFENSHISYIITTVCLSVRPSDDGSVFEWTGGTGPDGRIPKTGTGPDNRIPKRVMGITQQGCGGGARVGGGGQGGVFFFFFLNWLHEGGWGTRGGFF
jgi:hypothetical protein